MKVYDESVIESIVDIYRTSPINPHYPYGMDCSICRKAGIECYTDSGDGYECNTGYVKYLEQKLAERKQLAIQAISLERIEQAKSKISEINPIYNTSKDGRIITYKNYDDIISEVLSILNEMIEETKEVEW